MRHISNAFLFLRIFAFAAVVPYLLRLKLRKVGSILEPGRNSVPVPEDSVQKITGYVETAIRRGQPFVRRGCLTRELTRYYFLRRAGMDVALCFGMGLLTRNLWVIAGLSRRENLFLNLRIRALGIPRCIASRLQVAIQTAQSCSGSVSNS